MSNRSNAFGVETEEGRKYQHRWSKQSRYDRKKTEGGNKYSREGNLSPLRSPLREENSGRYNRSRKTEGRGYTNIRSEQQSQTPPNVQSTKEFPALSQENFLTLDVNGPETPCWATMVEEEEEKANRKLNNDRPRRRLKMSEGGSKENITQEETDATILARRQKDIDYGKNTLGYSRYIAAIDVRSRKPGNPKTPNKHVKFSRRSWDTQIRQWRRRLHSWDVPQQRKRNASEQSFDTITSDTTSISSLSLEDGMSVRSVSPTESRPVGNLGPEDFSPPCKYSASNDFQKIPVLKSMGRGSSPSAVRADVTATRSKAPHADQKYVRARSVDEKRKPEDAFFENFQLDTVLSIDDEANCI